MLDDLDIPAEALFDPGLKIPFLIGALGPDQLETRKDAWQGLQEQLASLMILDRCLVNQYVQQEAIGINQHMSLAAFHALATVIAAPPPFWLVLTD